MMRIRRAILFNPGDDRRKIEKGAALGVDSVILDLEDGVALNRKDAARETVAAALREVDFGRTERLVRLNAWGTGLTDADFDAAVPARPDGVVLPKVETRDQVRAIAARLDLLEAAEGWPQGEIRLLVFVETALGILNLREIAASTPRLDALLLGGEDLANDLGARRTMDGQELDYAKKALLVHARAYGLQAVDTVFTDLSDHEGLERDTRASMELGYTGRLAIHPRQVEVIQRVFTPSDEEIRRALRLTRAFEAHQAEGRGVFAYEGKMVDMPVVRVAQSVLARAAAAGIDPQTLTD
jgi:citrate lyase beta subunit